MQVPSSPPKKNLDSRGSYRNILFRPSEMIFAEGTVGFLEVGHARYCETGKFREINDSLLFAWCTSGTAVIDTVENVFELTPGDAYLAIPGTINNFSTKTLPFNGWRAVVSGPGLAELIATSNLRTGTIFGHRPPEHWLKRVMKDMTAKDSNDNPQVSQDRLARQLIAEIEHHTQNYPDPPELMRAISAIDASLSDWDFTIATLADSLKWHHGSLISMFKANFNMTPSRYLLKRRMLRAANQLEETMLSISQIAENCGFVNLTSFSRSFRRFHGVSPRAFREQKKSRPG